LGKALSGFSIAMPLCKRSIQKWFVEIGVEELDYPAQSPDLNPIKQLWDELESKLRARTNRPHSIVPTASRKPSQESGGERTNSILMPMILE
jgi:hypothetical protein